MPPRDVKFKGHVTAHLKVRPFKTRRKRLFQRPVKPCPSTLVNIKHLLVQRGIALHQHRLAGKVFQFGDECRCPIPRLRSGQALLAFVGERMGPGSIDSS